MSLTEIFVSEMNCRSRTVGEVVVEKISRATAERRVEMRALLRIISTGVSGSALTELQAYFVGLLFVPKFDANRAISLTPATPRSSKRCRVSTRVTLSPVSSQAIPVAWQCHTCGHIEKVIDQVSVGVGAVVQTREMGTQTVSDRKLLIESGPPVFAGCSREVEQDPSFVGRGKKPEGTSVVVAGCIPKTVSVKKEKYPPYPLIRKAEAKKNSEIWAIKLQRDPNLFAEVLDVGHGCKNCQDPSHKKKDCWKRIGTTCGRCGTVGVLHEYCPFCSPEQYGLTVPAWYRSHLH